MILNDCVIDGFLSEAREINIIKQGGAAGTFTERLRGTPKGRPGKKLPPAELESAMANLKQRVGDFQSHEAANWPPR